MPEACSQESLAALKAKVALTEKVLEITEMVQRTHTDILRLPDLEPPSLDIEVGVSAYRASIRHLVQPGYLQCQPIIRPDELVQHCANDSAFMMRFASIIAIIRQKQAEGCQGDRGTGSCGLCASTICQRAAITPIHQDAVRETTEFHINPTLFADITKRTCLICLTASYCSTSCANRALRGSSNPAPGAPFGASHHINECSGPHQAWLDTLRTNATGAALETIASMSTTMAANTLKAEARLAEVYDENQREVERLRLDIVGLKANAKDDETRITQLKHGTLIGAIKLRAMAQQSENLLREVVRTDTARTKLLRYLLSGTGPISHVPRTKLTPAQSENVWNGRRRQMQKLAAVNGPISLSRESHITGRDHRELGDRMEEIDITLWLPPDDSQSADWGTHTHVTIVQLLKRADAEMAALVETSIADVIPETIDCPLGGHALDYASKMLIRQGAAFRQNNKADQKAFASRFQSGNAFLPLQEDDPRWQAADRCAPTLQSTTESSTPTLPVAIPELESSGGELPPVSTSSPLAASSSSSSSSSVSPSTSGGEPTIVSGPPPLVPSLSPPAESPEHDGFSSTDQDPDDEVVIEYEGDTEEDPDRTE